MYSTHNEGKSVITEKFIGTLKNKIYKYMTSISKNVYIDKLDDIVNKYNDTYHSTIQMKLVDVKPNTYITSSKEINYQYPNFKIRDIVRTSKYKNIFVKMISLQFDLKKFLCLRKLKILCRGRMLLMVLVEKKFLEHFTKNNNEK